jgi:hypothetical protein
LPDGLYDLTVEFSVVSPIRNIETIASGTRLRVRRYLWQQYGRGDWRKMKGIAEVMYADGSVCLVELHWYEAHGIGRREFKDKKLLREL